MRQTVSVAARRRARRPVIGIARREAMSDLYPVKPGFAAHARIGKDEYQRLYRESVEDPEGFWARAAGRLDWFRKPTVIKDVSFDLEDFRIRWFADGELNASVNCLDRQLEKRGDKTAILFEPDSPDAPAQKVSYRQLYERVCKLGRSEERRVGKAG